MTDKGILALPGAFKKEEVDLAKEKCIKRMTNKKSSTYIALPLGSDKIDKKILNMRQKLFTAAWHRQSWAMFDNLGIDMNKKKLRGAPVMNYSRTQLYGYDGSWLTKLWCRKIRPRFFKLQQMALEEAYRTISEALQDEQRQSILTQAKEKGLISKDFNE